MLDIRPNIPLQALNTLALPSRAEHFCRVTSNEQLLEALDWARANRQRITVLGGGSNVVLAGDIPGLVVAMAIPGISLAGQTAEKCLVSVGAGENWHQLVLHTLAQGWFGLENLALIPGLAGAAPIQNIGAYGVELRERFHSLEALHVHTGERVSMYIDDCRFGYRDSVFKQSGRDRYVITSVTLALSSVPELRLEYPALQQALADHDPVDITPALVAEVVCEIRRSKLPDPVHLPNAGSFFKNPVISAEQSVELQRSYPHLVSYPQPDGRVKLAAGWLVDQAGWKGTVRGNVGVHDQQALVLVNRGGTGEELLALADAIAHSVYQQFEVELELEPRVYP
ncbi:MAG: UDP-N-acetylmuramate dehydrogenase [Porticoccaceae bacterium]